MHFPLHVVKDHYDAFRFAACRCFTLSATTARWGSTRQAASLSKIRLRPFATALDF
jgi:hypothetical protein